MEHGMAALVRPMYEHEHISAGPLALSCCWEQRRLKRLKLSWSTWTVARSNLSPAAMALLEALEEYVISGQTVWPELPLAWEILPNFTRRVLETLCASVGPGQTVRYGELAARCGNSRAARAVGQAMASNPWPLVVPCHRVLPASNRVGYFSNAGPAMKEFLLKLEKGI